MLEPTAASVIEEVPTGAEESNQSAVSWGAIIAGGVASAALTLILLAFGAGVGFSTISPWSASSGPSTSFHIAAGLYFIVTAMLASSVGGYLAGRLRTRWTNTHSREVFFRDTAHGFLAWGLATLLSAGVLGSASGGLVGGASMTSLGVSGQYASVLDHYVDELVRVQPGVRSAAGVTTPSAESIADRGVVGRIFATAFRNNGEFAPADRVYLTQIVRDRQGVGSAEAETLVNAALSDAKLTLTKIQKAAAQLALWLTASLFVGAFSASLAAIEGGGLRDGTWHYKV
jgi:hypothetical protein